jgi:hypothetical protein
MKKAIAGSLLIVLFGIIGAVCTACAAPAAAQAVIPTSTPNPAIEQARQDALRAQQDAANLTNQYGQQVNQLRGLQTEIDNTQAQLDKANTDAVAANERANALDAQGAASYANSSAQAANAGLAQLKQLNDQVTVILHASPQVVDLIKRNGQLAADNAQLRATVYGLTGTVAMQTQQITVYQNEPKQQPFDPLLLAGVIICVIAIALVCLTYFFSNRQPREQPPIVYQLQPNQPSAAPAADEVIDG